jgi:hypothetical protein
MVPFLSLSHWTEGFLRKNTQPLISVLLSSPCPGFSSRDYCRTGDTPHKRKDIKEYAHLRKVENKEKALFILETW